MIDTFHFLPGDYYIGDLCYVLDNDWDEVCDITIKGNACLDGLFTLADGRKFGLWRTAHGDGMYEDTAGCDYPVDSGSIGIIAVKDIADDEKTGVRFGEIVEFDQTFDVTGGGGEFRFGDIYIDTRYEDQDDLYEDEDEYDQLF